MVPCIAVFGISKRMKVTLVIGIIVVLVVIACLSLWGLYIYFYSVDKPTCVNAHASSTNDGPSPTCETPHTDQTAATYLDSFVREVRSATQYIRTTFGQIDISKWPTLKPEVPESTTHRSEGRGL